MNQFFYVKTSFDIYELFIVRKVRKRDGAATDKPFPQHLR